MPQERMVNLTFHFNEWYPQGAPLSKKKKKGGRLYHLLSPTASSSSGSNSMTKTINAYIA